MPCHVQLPPTGNCCSGTQAVNTDPTSWNYWHLFLPLISDMFTCFCALPVGTWNYFYITFSNALWVISPLSSNILTKINSLRHNGHMFVILGGGAHRLWQRAVWLENVGLARSLPATLLFALLHVWPGLHFPLKSVISELSHSAIGDNVDMHSFSSLSRIGGEESSRFSGDTQRPGGILLAGQPHGHDPQFALTKLQSAGGLIGIWWIVEYTIL